jgi:hypothetical protein
VTSQPEIEPDLVPTIMRDLMGMEDEADVWDLAPALFFVAEPGADQPDKPRVAPFLLDSPLWQMLGELGTVLDTLVKAVEHPDSPPLPIPLEPTEKVTALVFRSDEG